MGLLPQFDLSRKSSLSDKSKIAKVNSPAKSSKKQLSSNTLLDKLEVIKIQSQQYLGKYQEKVSVVRSKSELTEYIDRCVEQGVCALDTETTGLDPLTEQVVGVCLYTPGQKAVYIPVLHRSYMTGDLLPNQLTKDDLRVELARLKPLKIVMHHAKFDIRMVKHNIGVLLPCYWDTMLATRVLNENAKSAALKYQYATNIEGHEPEYDYDTLFRGIDYRDVPIELAAMYAAVDPLITYELFKFQENEINKPENAGMKNILLDIEMPLLPCIVEQEDTGVCIDTELAAKLSMEYHSKLDIIEAEVHEELKNYAQQIRQYRILNPDNKLEDPISVTSPVQLAILLYDIIKVPAADPKKPRGTGEEILKKINLPICDKILEYRGVQKLLTTYIDKLPAVANTKTKRIHASFNQIGADCITGDTPVVTANGVERMDAIVGKCEDKQYADFKVSLVNERNEIEETSHKIMFVDVPTIKIKTTYGFQLEGTPNHPVRVIDKNVLDFRKNKSNKVLREMWDTIQWKNLEDIKYGDLVLIDATQHSFTFDYIETSFDQNVNNKTHKISAKMPKYFDEEFAEFLGMLHSDGALKKSDGSWRLTLYNEHKDVVERWKYLCHKLFDLEAKKEYTDGTFISGWSITGAKLEQLFRYINTGKHNKCIPEVIYRSTDSVFYSYLKGCSLDSGYNGEEKLNYHFMSEYDCRAVQQRLLKQGILSSAQTTRRSESDDCKLVISTAYDSMSRFLALTGLLYRKSAVKLLTSKKYNFTRCYKHDNLLAVQVVKVENSRNTVYDFTLPKTHSFLANGFICHNTGRFSSSDPKRKLGLMLAIA